MYVLCREGNTYNQMYRYFAPNFYMLVLYVLISVCAGGLVSGTMDDEVYTVTVLCAQLAKIGGKKRKKQTKVSKFLVYSWSLTECILVYCITSNKHHGIY